MMTINDDFRNKVREALLAVRPHFDGGDSMFATQWGINPSVFNRIKKGQVSGVLADGKWLDIGRELGVGIHEKKWNTAQTDVFNTISQDIAFCQENSKAMIFVDECEIGKTHTAKYLAKTRNSCFYVDCSGAKTRNLFIKKIAKTIGVDQNGKFADVKDNIKYYLKIMNKPVIILDEAGDLNYEAFLELKELWNATEGCCGWYLMGADGLRAKIKRGITHQQVGFKEIFSRFGGKFSSVVPSGRLEKLTFYQKLLSDVLQQNVEDKATIPSIINKCITRDEDNNIGGLRRAESILILHQ